MSRLLFAAFAAGLVALAHITFTEPTGTAPPLSANDVAKLRAIIRPLEGEDPFDTIPWETNLWEARQKAADAGKPILLWEMDGHPLGCG